MIERFIDIFDNIACGNFLLSSIQASSPTLRSSFNSCRYSDWPFGFEFDFVNTYNALPWVYRCNIFNVHCRFRG